MRNICKIVNVEIIKENGWYIATSPDLPGLIVCHQKFLKFVKEIPECINALMQCTIQVTKVKEISLLEQDLAKLRFAVYGLDSPLEMPIKEGIQ
jgi:hypothetical protein